MNTIVVLSAALPLALVAAGLLGIHDLVVELGLRVIRCSLLVR